MVFNEVQIYTFVYTLKYVSNRELLQKKEHLLVF
jgi:hypothetical protein